MTIKTLQGSVPSIGRGVFVHSGTVMLGEGVLVWPGTVIRGDANSTRVGAGSLVPKRRVLASGWLDLSHPACLMRRLTAEEVAHSV